MDPTDPTPDDRTPERRAADRRAADRRAGERRAPESDADLAPPRSAWGRMRDDLRPWAQLSDRQWVLWASVFRLRHVAARDTVLAPGADRHELIYVSTGLLRFYYLAADGTESNKAFVAERNFAGALAAAALRLPVVYGIEALEPSTLLVADLADVAALYDEHPVFDRIGRRFAELLLARKELRARGLLQQNATERWLDFARQHPELVRRVPQYHVASYLGITEASLSRLKRELRERTSQSASRGTPQGAS